MNCDYCGKEKWELMTIQVEWVTYYNCWPCTKLYLAQYGWDVDNITGYFSGRIPTKTDPNQPK